MKRGRSHVHVYGGGRAGPLAAVVLGAVLLAVASPAHAQGCWWDGEGGGGCDFGFDEGGSDTSGSDDDNFWDILGVWLAVIFALISTGVFIMGAILVRRRRLSVGAYLERLDQTYALYRHDPDEAIPRLAALREEVRQRYTAGRLEDAPFLELEKRITGYISRMRLAEVEETVPDLPVRIRQEVERLVSDGTVSQKDLEKIEELASRSRLAKGKREPLMALLEDWAEQDMAPDPAPPREERKAAAPSY